MKKHWVDEIWRLTGFLLLGAFFGLIFNAMAWFLFAALFAYVLYQFRQIHALNQWLSNRLDADLHVGGIWEELAYRIYQKRKRSRRRKKRLSRMLRRFQDSVSMMPDAAIVLDKENNILWMNQAASEYLGLEPTDLGNNICNLIRQPMFIRFLNRARKVENLEMSSPADDSQSLDLRIMPYGEGQRLLLVRNVTQIQQLKTMRQEFVANVSHELRTPLTIIMGYLETLIETDDLTPDEIRHRLSKLDAPSRRMKQIVEDLLLLSRLDIDVPPESAESPRIDVATLLKMVKKDAEQLSNNRHQITVDIDCDVKLHGVESEIYSAISNLTSNAIRYSPDGGMIEIKAWLDDKNLNISVSDQGLGIPREHIPRLTERFYRVDVGRSREAGGTGLGLAIVKQVLRRHDAVLDVVSEPGEGSLFTCRFPLARIELPEVVTKAS